LRLTLEAGCDLLVAPGRSILVRGPLLVRGTAERPVRVRGLSPPAPWGVLAAQGSGVDRLDRAPRRPRSEIDHLILEGGSEDALKGAFYSGQLSVYHQDLVMRNAALSGSFAADSLSVKYGHVAIADSSFTDSAADAIDLDWTDGTVTRSRFEGTGPGGDGLDLSGSTVEVEDSVFAGAGDKCLSVGEASSLRLRGSLLRDCAIGVASKDRSHADIADSVFLRNGRDLAAYRKKPIFGGATIRAERLLLVGAGEPPEADVLSEIDILASVQLVRPESLAAGALAALDGATAFSTDRYQRLSAALGADSGEARP
jgi:hypothetical protein